MPIILNDFAGMVPKLDGRSLPANASQKAVNVNIVNGKLAPINVPGPFQVEHDPDTGAMKSGIQDGNILAIDEPSTPAVSEKIRLFRPMDWTNSLVSVNMWVTYFDSSSVFTTDSYAPSFVAGSNEWEYTEDGIILRAYLNQRTFTAEAGLYYQVHGPKFKFHWEADTKYFGGPDQTWNFPDTTLSRTSPDIPYFSMPLTAPIDYTGYTNDGDAVYAGSRYTYGHMQLVSINAPVTLPVIDMTTEDSNTTVTLIEAGYVEFYFKANYVRNSQVFVNYSRTLVDQRVAEGSANQAYPAGAVTQIDMKSIEYGESNLPATGKVRLINSSDDFEDVDYTSYVLNGSVYEFTVSDTLTNSYDEDDDVVIIDTDYVGKEGPPSELGEIESVDPGELVNLSVALPDGFYRQNIYRSSSDSDFRLLVDELTTDTYIDTFIKSLGVDLPPYGNYPHDTLAEAKEGSVVLGGHTALIFDGYDVRPSEPYKQWVYPEEYAFPLDSPFLAATSFGSSAVVFTQTHPISGDVGKVYLFSGQNPAYLNRLEISDDKPLLNKRSLCKIDNMAFYATTDGLCAVSPSGIQIITENLFTRSQWADYNPQLMSAYTADNSIFVVSLDATAPIHFRFDLGEGGSISTFTRYTAFSDADLYWKSKIFETSKPINYRNVQIIADGYPVQFTIIGDCGVVKHTMLIPDEKARMLPRLKRCRDWEFEVSGRSTISRVAITSSIQELNA